MYCVLCIVYCVLCIVYCILYIVMKYQINMANLVYVASSPKCSCKNIYDRGCSSIVWTMWLKITVNFNAIYCFLFCILGLLRNKRIVKFINYY